MPVQVEEQCHHELLSEDDGSFFMEWGDFTRYMGEVGSCSPFMVWLMALGALSHLLLQY